MGLYKQSVFRWILFLIIFPFAKSILYGHPTIWTRCYMGISSERDPNKEYAGHVFMASSEADDTEMTVNAIGHGNILPIPAEAVTEQAISSSSIQALGSHLTPKLSFAMISVKPLAIFYRDRLSFYQLREKHMLPSVYTITTYHKPSTQMLSVVHIASLFEGTKVTVTFQDGVNVVDALGDLSLNLTINGQSVSQKFGYRAVLKLQTSVDLTGTVISTSNELSVVAGTVPLDVASQISYIDHSPGDVNTGTEYVVFGLPVVSGSCVCRVMAVAENIDVAIDGTTTATLSSRGDFHDVIIQHETFVHINASNNVSVALLVEGTDSSDMVVAFPLGFQNSTKYTFTVPEFATDVNVSTYLVLTLTQTDASNILLNGQSLPVDVTWLPVPGTDYVGAYIPVSHLGTTQSISSGSEEYFNAYLIGIGTGTTYGSAVIPYEAPEYNTDNLQFSTNRTFCGSQGSSEERTTLPIKKGKRKVSYELKHFRTAHAQACQRTCLLHNDCVGVNYKAESAAPEKNCDIMMPGPLNTIKTGAWTHYKIIR